MLTRHRARSALVLGGMFATPIVIRNRRPFSSIVLRAADENGDPALREITRGRRVDVDRGKVQRRPGSSPEMAQPRERERERERELESYQTAACEGVAQRRKCAFTTLNANKE